MRVNNETFYKTNVTLRVTSLWAFSEAFMGGILHGFNIPFAGLVLALVASVCITLIALGSKEKGEILKAALLVIAIKFILSPHTPPMAYLAVAIQGAVGELFFLNKKNVKLSAFLLTLFSLMYSAFQHLLVLTIIFGTGFWQAIDIFLNKITHSFFSGAVQYSWFIVALYLACYFIAGIAGGILNIKIINSIQSGDKANLLIRQLDNLAVPAIAAITATSKKGTKNITFIFAIVLLLALIFSYLPYFNHLFYQSPIPEIIIRGSIIIFVWNYCVVPILRLQIQKWVTHYKEKNGNTLQQVIILLPDIKIIVQQSWQLSHHQNKWLRLKSFINNAVTLIVHYEK